MVFVECSQYYSFCKGKEITIEYLPINADSYTNLNHL